MNDLLLTLKKIKRLKYSQLKEIAKKLDIIRNNKSTPIDIVDLEDAITFCKYHFTGGLLESFGLEMCPCNCYCESCEVIPTEVVSMRMQEIASEMGEENVFNEFIEQYGKVNGIQIKR